MKNMFGLLKEGYLEMAEESRKIMDDFEIVDRESLEHFLKYF